MKFLEKVKLWFAMLIWNLKMNIKGGSSMGSAGAIVGLVLAVYVMAYTLPDALVAMSCQTSYSGAGTAVINIATIVAPILIVFGCILYLLPSEIKTKVGLG